MKCVSEGFGGKERLCFKRHGLKLKVPRLKNVAGLLVKLLNIVSIQPIGLNGISREPGMLFFDKNYFNIVFFQGVNVLFFESIIGY